MSEVAFSIPVTGTIQIQSDSLVIKIGEYTLRSRTLTTTLELQTVEAPPPRNADFTTNIGDVKRGLDSGVVSKGVDEFRHDLRLE